MSYGRNVVKGFRKSLSNWEDSLFGGYRKVLWDYPTIKVNFDVEWKVGDTQELSYFNARKLIELFLLKANEYSLISMLLSKAKVERTHTTWGKKIIRCTVTPESLEQTLNLVIRKEVELQNMFEYFRKVILSTEIYSTEIYYDQPDTSESKDNSDDEDESDSPQGKSEPGSDDDSEEGESDSDSKSNEEQPEESKDGSGDSDNSSEESKKEQSSDGTGDTKESSKESREKNKGEGTGESKEQSEREKRQQHETIQKGMLSFKKALGETKVRVYDYQYNWNGPGVTGDLKKAAKFELMKSGTPCRYTPSEEANANHLVNMLDISFDPKEDVIKSLRSGKLDIAKICEVPSGNFNVYKRTEEDQITRPFSVCILCDESGSMEGSDKLRSQLSIVKMLYKAVSQIIPDEKIFVYGHSSIQRDDDSSPNIRIYQDKYNLLFEESINTMMGNRHGNNYDGPAIECIYEKVRSFTQDNIIFILLSDGQPAGNGYGGKPAIDDMKKIIEKCKRDGFVTIGIGVLHSTVKGIYNYHVDIRDLGSTFPQKVSMLINHVVKTEFQS